MSSTTFTLSYLRDIEKYRTEKPFNLSFSKYHDGIVTNVEQEDRLVEVHDVRGKESDFTCTSHSFSYRTFPTKYPIDGTEAQTFQHLEEAQQFLKQEFDAVEVICYDIRRRSSDTQTSSQTQRPTEGYFTALEDVAPPVYNVHIDHSLEGGFQRIKRHLSKEECAKYLAPGWRVRIVNLWRPLKKVMKAPLAVCDYNTVQMTELAETDQVNESWYGEIYLAKFSPHHRFYWLRDQSPDEICLMLMFDSHNGEPETEMHCCAHASCRDPNLPDDAPERESIEIRAIVVSRIDEVSEKLQATPADTGRLAPTMSVP